MRKVLLIVLGSYLAIGLVVALVWMPGTYLCPGYRGPDGFTTMDKSCHHITSSGDRLRFIGEVAPTWPRTLIRDGIRPPPVGP